MAGHRRCGRKRTRVGHGVRSSRATLAGNTSWVSALVADPNAAWLATVNRDGTTHLWSTTSWKRLRTLALPTGAPASWSPSAVRATATSPDGALLTTVDSAGTVWTWNTAAGTLLTTATCSTGPVGAAAVSPDGRWFAIAGSNGAVSLHTRRGRGQPPRPRRTECSTASPGSSRTRASEAVPELWPSPRTTPRSSQ
ncbi:hypothetical protein AB0D54_26240 [Streptomyces xanthophaeus]|uniref:WD40 repeat domain-containing protein n=1 Tax=Streptomyces xanthophaeus TaxID=67385 RepID=UPI003421DD41